MENKESCINCQTMKEQVEELKRKHLLDFRTIKQKIISTDELIKLYQKKCQEHDKQTKYVTELISKVEALQRNMDVVRLQLEKSLEINEPLKKACSQFEKENGFHRIEVQKLQDRLRGSESLVSQFKNVVKEKEMSEGSCRLDVTIQGQEIEEQKKSLKKNESLIKKLKEQLLLEKDGKKEINKQLSTSQNQLKKKEKQVGDFQPVIAKLTQQLKEAKKEITGLNKSLKEKIHSPPKQVLDAPSKHTRRTTRWTIALEKQENTAVGKSSEILMDEITEMLNFAPFTLSPLPPSPYFSEKDSDSSDDDNDNDELGNDDPDYIDHDDERQCVDDNLRSGTGKSENDKSEYAALKSPCSMSGPLRAKGEDITNNAISKTNSECSPEHKTTFTNTVDEVNDVATERAPFSMSLRSEGNRKRKRLNSQSEMCSQMSEVVEESGGLKMKKLAGNRNAPTDERSGEERETKMTKRGPETDLGTNSETILSTSKSLTESRLKMTEEVELEVSACLRSIVEAVELQQSTMANVQTSYEHDKSFVEINFDTAIVSDHLETNHEETTSIDRDVLDCLKSIIENVSRNVEAIVNDNSEVCNDVVGLNGLDNKTTVPFGVGIVDLHRNTSGVPCDETVQSSPLICEQTHKNVDKNRRYSKSQKKIQESDSCFDTRDHFGNTDKDHSVSGTQENASSKAEGDLKEYTEDISNGVSSNQDTDKVQDSSAESCLNRSLTFSPDIYAPLSPIPDSPETSTQRTEIPSFEVFYDLPPLSPIPPSPKGLSEIVEPKDQGGSDTTPDELELKKLVDVVPASIVIKFPEQGNSSSSVATLANQLSADEVNIAEKMTEVEPENNIKTRFKPAIKNYLDRPAKVKEHVYVLRLLTKVKKGEITTETATKRLSSITNLRASSPFVSALLQILKRTPDTVNEELIKKYTEQYEGVCDGEIFQKVWRPVITEFEMRVAVVVRELSKLEQFQALFGCLLSLLGKTMFGLFISGDSGFAVLAICRMYTTLCRLMGDCGRVHLLCFDIIKENQRYLLTNEIIMSVGLVWPQVLRFKAARSWCLLSGKLITHGLPFQPFLSTLHVITMSRETSCEFEQSILVFQRLCGWSKLPCGREALELLAPELVRLLGESSNVVTQDTESDFGPSMGSEAFETVKSLELLAVVMGWEWTNDVLIRDELWPVLQEWKRKEVCGRDVCGSDAVLGGSYVKFTGSNCVGNSKVELSRETLSQKSETFIGHPHKETTGVQDLSQAAAVYSQSENGASKDVNMDVETMLQAADLRKESSDCMEDEGNVSGFHGNPSKDSFRNGRSGLDEKEKGLEVLGVRPKMEERIAFQTTDVDSANTRDVVMDVTVQIVKMGEKSESNIEKHNMEETVVSILRLLGLLGLVGLQQEVHLDAVVNLVCAVMTSCVDKPKGVTFAVQLAAAYAALDLLKANPTKILKVLNEWSARVTEGKNLPVHFTKQLKHFRTYLSSRKPL